MARKLEEDLDVSAEKPSSKKGAAATKSKVATVKIVAYSITAALLIGVILYGLHINERALILNTRFALSGPEGSEDTSTLAVAGATYVSANAIKAVFHDDLGKSVYLLPLAERRESLRQVSWVKDASVARLWPNRVQVRVWERTPVAFVALPESKYGLIDEEGVLLPSVSARFHLPVLHGVNTSASLADRKERVRRMQRLQQELGEANTQDISEIDVGDRDNLKIARPYGGHVLTLLLGDHNFAARYQNFKQHFEEIRRRLPDAVTLDLRLEDRITVVQ